jgi:hypothetical protein
MLPVITIDTLCVYRTKLMFFDSREEREQCVIDPYKQGKSIRDIAQEVHMSFSDMGAIIRKVTGDNRPKNHEVTTQSSKDTQAFKLFLEGKKPGGGYCAKPCFK